MQETTIFVVKVLFYDPRLQPSASEFDQDKLKRVMRKLFGEYIIEKDHRQVLIANQIFLMHTHHKIAAVFLTKFLLTIQDKVDGNVRIYKL